MLKKLIYSLIFLIIPVILNGQVIEHPNCGMIRPVSLSVLKVETTGTRTKLYFSLQNQIKDGYFCAEKSIYLVYPDGTKSKLSKATGIPVCPDVHRFREPGEKIDFVLEFPALKAGTLWVDLLEECTSDCMNIYGITLDNSLNKELDDLFAGAEKVTPEESILMFRKMIEKLNGKTTGIEGLLYINIINASLEANDKVGASVWYRRLLSSGAPRLSYYIKYLNDKGVRF